MTYAVAMLLFSLVGFVLLYALQRLQAILPFNPQGQAAVAESLAFNTSVSFTTNTNWQSYVPNDDELSRADGRSDGAQFRIGGDRRCAGDRAGTRVRATLGTAHRQFLGRSDARHALRAAADFDRGRAVLRLAGHAAEPRRLHRSDDARGGKAGHRAGAVASQEVIKMLGTNGGGFFNANSAHPFENPNAITNWCRLF